MFTEKDGHKPYIQEEISYISYPSPPPVVIYRQNSSSFIRVKSRLEKSISVIIQYVIHKYFSIKMILIFFNYSYFTFKRRVCFFSSRIFFCYKLVQSNTKW